MPDTLVSVPRRKKPETESAGPAVQSGTETETVRIDKRLARMLTMIAIRRGVSVSDLLTPQIRPWVEELYRKTVLEMASELKKPE